MHPAQSHRDALNKAVQDILQDTVPSSGRHNHTTLSDSRSTIYTLVQQTLQQYSRQLNNEAPINNLPAEIFIDILSWTTFDDVVSATHVCQFWRATALSNASLWASMINRHTPFSYLTPSEDFLNRTKDTPLDLNLRIRRPPSVEVLEKHLRHTRSLTLSVDYDFGGMGTSNNVITLLLYALRHPAPLLEQLSLSFEHPASRGEFPSIPIDLFAGMAPRLHTVTAVGARFPHHPYAAFSNVRKFMFRASRALLLGRHEAMPPIDMVKHVTGYDKVKHLIVLQDPLHPAQVLTEPTDLTETCREMGARLDILEVSYSSDTLVLLHALRDAPPKLLCIHNADPEFMMNDLIDPGASIVRLRFGSRGHAQNAIEVTDAHGNARRATAIMAPENAEDLWDFIPLTVFATVTSLSMHEHMWPDEQLPAAFALQELKIFIGTHDARAPHLSGIFQLSPDPKGPWAVPSLQRLTLSSICWQPPRSLWTRGQRASLRVSADDIYRFLVDHLSPSQLQCLILECISLYDTPDGTATASLRRRVGELTTSGPEGMPEMPDFYNHVGPYVPTTYYNDFL
ncbi:hypothetical protein EXIGLDRAFT_838612 [Exidia glandulosa HHB12029]|uniref:F-box domain-containing protein n=1 Tax=Exidia glandulosa HHB12029 TaxID=1314781 RepID=A0A165FP38_EXIGL|nr:hypothetical protein EXIGLDRAFT_838612 [Exidia glandulosa HHB12029]